LRRVAIAGTGAALPPRTVTNAELSAIVETDDEWIVSRTGIRERRVVALEPLGSGAGGRTPTLDLAERAAKEAITAARIDPASIGLVIVATCTPDFPGFPAVAPLLAGRVGAKRAAAFDLSLACTGFVAALHTASMFLRAGAHDAALVVGVDVMSGITDWKDRNTCIIFADGAGAAIVRAHPEGPEASKEPLRGELLYGALSSDGDDQVLVVEPSSRFIRMKGKETFKFAVQAFVREIELAAASVGRHAKDLDWVVPHQVNRRVMESAASRLELPLERVVQNIDRLGNTSAASVPIALDEAARDGRLQTGQLVCLVAFGAGLAQGAVLVRW